MPYSTSVPMIRRTLIPSTPPCRCRSASVAPPATARDAARASLVRIRCTLARWRHRPSGPEAGAPSGHAGRTGRSCCARGGSSAARPAGGSTVAAFPGRAASGRRAVTHGRGRAPPVDARWSVRPSREQHNYDRTTVTASSTVDASLALVRVHRRRGTPGSLWRRDRSGRDRRRLEPCANTCRRRHGLRLGAGGVWPQRHVRYGRRVVLVSATVVRALSQRVAAHLVEETGVDKGRGTAVARPRCAQRRTGPSRPGHRRRHQPRGRLSGTHRSLVPCGRPRLIRTAIAPLAALGPAGRRSSLHDSDQQRRRTSATSSPAVEPKLSASALLLDRQRDQDDGPVGVRGRRPAGTSSRSPSGRSATGTRATASAPPGAVLDRRSLIVGFYRYWPVLLTVSMDRPASAPLPPETSVRM